MLRSAQHDILIAVLTNTILTKDYDPGRSGKFDIHFFVLCLMVCNTINAWWLLVVSPSHPQARPAPRFRGDNFFGTRLTATGQVICSRLLPKNLTEFVVEFIHFIGLKHQKDFFESLILERGFSADIMGVVLERKGSQRR